MSSQLLQSAILFASTAHEGQWREGPDPMPYITHPLDVLEKLRDTGGVTEESMLIAAVLHDTLEECDVAASEISARFGEDVSSLVRELTRTEPSQKETSHLSKGEIWRLRADMLLAEVTQMSPRAKTIKLADRFSNLEEATRVKLGKKLERYIWQTERLLEAIPRETNPPLWDAVAAFTKTSD
jgi:guanosine-3',5'-bis(diphosphate) 3'-pyrophosphohydrolase